MQGIALVVNAPAENNDCEFRSGPATIPTVRRKSAIADCGYDQTLQQGTVFSGSSRA